MQIKSVPVELESLQALCYLEDQVEALVWLTCGQGQNLTLHTMVRHVLQQAKYCQQDCTILQHEAHGH